VNRELLTTFLTTVELGSFSLAAEALHLAQSSVSRQIAVLERELEAPLFERQGRLRLTPAGERLTVLAHRYLSLRQRLAEECRSADAGLQPLTVFACSPGCSLLEPLLEELTGRGIAPLLRLMQERSLAPALRSGRADAILTAGRPPEGVCLTLWEGPLWLCGRRDDPIFSDLRVENLAGRTMICGLPGDPDGPEMLEVLAPGRILESNHLCARLPLLCAGGALTLLPPGETAVLPPELLCRPVPGRMPQARYTLALSKDPMPAACLLLELAEEYCRNAAWERSP